MKHEPNDVITIQMFHILLIFLLCKRRANRFVICQVLHLHKDYVSQQPSLLSSIVISIL